MLILCFPLRKSSQLLQVNNTYVDCPLGNELRPSDSFPLVDKSILILSFSYYLRPSPSRDSLI